MKLKGDVHSRLPHQRKQYDISNRQAVGQQHDEAVDADTFPGGRRKPVFERPDVILVHLVRLEVASGAVRQLRLEPPPLLVRIVQLAEGVRHLETADVELEPLHGIRVVGLLFRQRRDLGRKVIDEGRLNQLVLAQPLEDLRRDLPGAAARVNLEPELPCKSSRRLALAQLGLGHLALRAASTPPPALPPGATAGRTGP